MRVRFSQVVESTMSVFYNPAIVFGAKSYIFEEPLYAFLRGRHLLDHLTGDTYQTGGTSSAYSTVLTCTFTFI